MIADLATQQALDRYHQAGSPGLTEEERTLATIWYFESKVANGGFQNFFKSNEGALAPYAPTAFRNIGAEPLADIAERANAVFGSTGVPGERAERIQKLAALPPSAHRLFDQLEADYADYGVDLDERLESYAAKTRHHVH